MVEPGEAVAGAGVEELLREGGSGQTHAEGAGTRQGEVEVLLVELDAEARIEGPFDHPLAVQLEDFRSRKAAHQRVTDPGRVDSALGGEEQCLADRLDGHGDDDLVGRLAGLTGAVVTDQGDVFAHQLEERLDALEGRLRSADHDGHSGVFGADLAARHRGVEVIAAEGVDLLGKKLGVDGRDGAHVDHRRARAKTLGGAVGPEEHLGHVGCVGHHDDDDLGPLRHLAAGAAFGRSTVEELPGSRVEVLDEQLMARGLQMTRHWASHDSGPDETDFCHIESSLGYLAIGMPSATRVPRSLWSPARTHTRSNPHSRCDPSARRGTGS